MKKIFEDNSYLEVVKSKTSNNFIVSLCTKDSVKENQIVMVSIEIDKDELVKIIEEAAEEEKQ